MDRVTIKAKSSVLCSKQLAQVVADCYGFTGPLSCELLAHGRNDTYRLMASKGTFFLKVHGTAPQTSRTLASEIEISLYLARHGLSVATPVPLTSGAYQLPVSAPEGTRLAVLHTEAPGRTLALALNNSTCEALGSILARIHASLVSCPAAVDSLRQLDFTKAFASLEAFGTSEQIAHRLRSARVMANLLLQSLSPPGGDITPCHGDFHDENVHVTDGGVISIFDFEEWHLGRKEYDLATFLRTLVLRYRAKTGDLSLSGFEQSPVHMFWRAFLRGYERHQRLAPEDIRAINTFVPLRRLVELEWSVERTTFLGRNYLHESQIALALDFMETWVARYRLL